MDKKIRCFEIVSFYLNKGIELPKRQTQFSAGYDFRSAQDIILEPKSIHLVPTGIKAFFPIQEVLMIFARSSLSIKKKLMLSNGTGIIDSDYYNNSENEGHIFISIYNFSNQTANIKKNERIAQGIFQKCFWVDECNHSENNMIPKRKSGFGSTNKCNINM